MQFTNFRLKPNAMYPVRESRTKTQTPQARVFMPLRATRLDKHYRHLSNSSQNISLFQNPAQHQLYED